MKISLTIVILFFLSTISRAQDSSRLDRLISAPDKLFSALDKKSKGLEEKLSKSTTRYLSRLQKQEEKLKRKLWKKDSLRAKEMFGDVAGRYEDLKNTTGKAATYGAAYSGRLDSLTTALKFLKDQNLTSSPEAQKLLTQYKDLQGRLNATEQIKKQLQLRQQQLRSELEKLGMIKELRRFRKQVFYYQAQVREFRQLLEDPSKLEAKLMELAMKIPQFKEFFARNSVLGSMFALPGSSGGDPAASLAGLQTRAQVSQSLVDRFGTGPNVSQQLQQGVQSAQGQLGELKNRLSSYSSGSYGNGGDIDQPIPGFKPNEQKTKSFLKRLEYGANVQSQKARYFFPVTSDLGLSLGYKLNHNGSVGIGASYKLGWGSGWNNIAITHQGVGLRSYVDWKLKGSFYLSGGYEQNYRSLINSVDQLREFSAWQRSGLIGLSKRYKLSGKMKGEMKLLWDFLSYQQVPRAQAVVFRVGYSLK